MGKVIINLVLTAIIIAVVAAGPMTETYDLSVAKVKIKPPSAAAGDSVKVTFTLKNDGPAESPAFKANIILIPESKDKKAGKGVTVKTLDVEPLAAAVKTKLSTTIEIGENIAKGTYQLRVDLVAKNGQDSKPANNTKKSKKTLEIK